MDDRIQESGPFKRKRTPTGAWLLGIIGAGLVIHGFNADPSNSMEYCGGFIVVGLALILEITSK